MQQEFERRYKFGRHDRVRIDGEAFQVSGPKYGKFQLQRETQGVLEGDFIEKSHDQISELIRDGRLAHDPDYYSKTMGFLRLRNDNSDLSTLSEEELRTIAWKTEWCVRFHQRRCDEDPQRRPKKTPPGLEQFIESERGSMDRWYFDLYGERRQPGRRRKGGKRKEFDYPSASGLRDWLTLFSNAGERMEAFRPRYDHCGNRNQLPKQAIPPIEQAALRFATGERPTIRDVYDDVLVALEKINATLPEMSKVSVSYSAVRRRVNKIHPFVLEAGRFGVDRAIRKYAPVGVGLSVHVPLERIEMDDWEFDLHSLRVPRDVWSRLSKKERKDLGLVRCNVTIAIDVATRCIVGFHLTMLPPGTQNSKSALRTVLRDKSFFAQYAGCNSTWMMSGRPVQVATDGGPAFQGDFISAARMISVNRGMPRQDPRMRGTIESFFRTFKRVCRYYSGRTFSNVVRRGDYKSEELASATFDDILTTSIRFIVDHYHHRPHRGLEGRTPHTEWKNKIKQGTHMDPSAISLATSFGYKGRRIVDKHGILHHCISYNSKALGLLAAKHVEKDVDFYIDPLDLGTIYVVVPDELRNDATLKPHLTGDYLPVKSVGDKFAGVSLERHVVGRQATLALAKQEELDGRPFRLAFHRNALAAGEQARHELGIDVHAFTQMAYDKLVEMMEEDSRGAFETPNYAETPSTSAAKQGTSDISSNGDDLPGESIASLAYAGSHECRPEQTLKPPTLRRSTRAASIRMRIIVSDDFKNEAS